MSTELRLTEYVEEGYVEGGYVETSTPILLQYGVTSLRLPLPSNMNGEYLAEQAVRFTPSKYKIVNSVLYKDDMFNLEFDNLLLSDILSLEAFYNTVNGITLPFTYTNVYRGVSKTVYMLDSNLNWELRDSESYYANLAMVSYL